MIYGIRTKFSSREGVIEMPNVTGEYKPAMIKTTWWFFGLISAYLCSSLLVFDFTTDAYPFDVEFVGGKHASLGPAPRIWVPFGCWKYDIPGGPSWTGSEWPFLVYRPICVLFVRAHGYELPR
jgi:hypothetical protein